MKYLIILLLFVNYSFAQNSIKLLDVRRVNIREVTVDFISEQGLNKGDLNIDMNFAGIHCSYFKEGFVPNIGMNSLTIDFNQVTYVYTLPSKSPINYFPTGSLQVCIKYTAKGDVSNSINDCDNFNFIKDDQLVLNQTEFNSSDNDICWSYTGQEICQYRIAVKSLLNENDLNTSLSMGTWEFHSPWQLGNCMRVSDIVNYNQTKGKRLLAQIEGKCNSEEVFSLPIIIHDANTSSSSNNSFRLLQIGGGPLLEFQTVMNPCYYKQGFTNWYFMVNNHGEWDQFTCFLADPQFNSSPIMLNLTASRGMNQVVINTSSLGNLSNTSDHKNVLEVVNNKGEIFYIYYQEQ